jgi:hypothetical protein
MVGEVVPMLARTRALFRMSGIPDLEFGRLRADHFPDDLARSMQIPANLIDRLLPNKIRKASRSSPLPASRTLPPKNQEAHVDPYPRGHADHPENGVVIPRRFTVCPAKVWLGRITLRSASTAKPNVSATWRNISVGWPVATPVQRKSLAPRSAAPPGRA